MLSESHHRHARGYPRIHQVYRRRPAERRRCGWTSVPGLIITAARPGANRKVAVIGGPLPNRLLRALPRRLPCRPGGIGFLGWEHPVSAGLESSFLARSCAGRDIGVEVLLATRDTSRGSRLCCWVILEAGSLMSAYQAQAADPRRDANAGYATGGPDRSAAQPTATWPPARRTPGAPGRADCLDGWLRRRRERSIATDPRPSILFRRAHNGPPYSPEFLSPLPLRAGCSPCNNAITDWVETRAANDVRAAGFSDRPVYR